jgi:NADPH:quinone reductase-like Zn-dependent oxidoreductase
MNALHLPGLTSDGTPPYSFPTHPPLPSSLRYTPSCFPLPTPDVRPSFLIRVLATSLTRSELTWSEVLSPSRFKPYGGAIPSHDLVGVIEKVLPAGRIDTELKEGDVVWGLVDFDRDGAAAEYVIALEGEVGLAPRCPKEVERERWYEQLATVPLSALTAWQGLFVHGGLSERRGEDNGAAGVIVLGSGAVARAAIELAGRLGLFVKVVASSRGAVALAADYVPSNLTKSQIIHDGLQLLQELTAIDTDSGNQKLEPVDLIFDTVGGPLLSQLLTASQLRTLVKAGARAVSIATPISAFGTDVEQSINRNCEAAQVSFRFFVVRPDREDLKEIGMAVEEGKLRGYVDCVWPLEKGREAMERVETRGSVKRGKVVLVSGHR